MNITAKYIVYVLSSIGAVAWGYFGLTGNKVAEDLLGLTDPTAGYFYLLIGAVGVLSLIYTAMVWDDIDPTVVVLAYVLADIGAVLWGVYEVQGQVRPENLEFLSFVPSGLWEGVYLLVGAAGLISLALVATMMSEDTSAEDADDVMG